MSFIFRRMGAEGAALKERLLGSEKQASPPMPPRIPLEKKISATLEAAANGELVSAHLPGATACLEGCTPFAALAIKLMAEYVIPFYTYVYARAYELYSVAPTNLLQCACGLALCFFGGTFTASVAAIEAFRLMGWAAVKADVAVVVAEYNSVSMASGVDDEKDDDGDGVADVDQISPSELLQRRIEKYVGAGDFRHDGCAWMGWGARNCHSDRLLPPALVALCKCAHVLRSW